MTRSLLSYRRGILVLLFVALYTMSLYAADCDSVNVPLNSKFRFLGSWTSTGKPLYLDPKGDTVSQDMIRYVRSVLPESVNLPNSNSDFFGDDVQLNTELTKKSKVYITMVDEGAGWTNTLGFYTYKLDSPPATVYDIDSLVVLFPNVSQPNVVQAGNKIYLGEFPANTGIGYFLIAQGWVQDTICNPSHIVFTDRHLNTFTSTQYQQQTILLHYEPEDQFMLCFEDIKRPGGDNDFNDAVFYITAEPGAIDTTDVAKVPTAILSGDATLCSTTEKAKLRIDFTGTAPWNVVYSVGGIRTTINDIKQSPYFFETAQKGLFTLVSVKDKYKSGIVSGSANVNVNLPTAKITNMVNNCGDEPAVISLDFTGNSPWTVSYTVNNVPATANSSNPTLNLPVEQTGMFQLVSVSDAYCRNAASGSAEIKHYEQPVAVLSGEAVLCNGESGNATISLTGIAPFTITYTDGTTETTVATSQNSYTITSAVPQVLTLLSVQDKNCLGDAHGTAEFIDGSKPLDAEIISESESCSEEPIALSLDGEIEGVTVSWSSSGQGTIDNADQVSAIYHPTETEAGDIVFTVQLHNGCAATTLTSTVTILEKPNAAFTIEPDGKLLSETQISFVPEEGNADGYLWDFGDGTTSNDMNAVHEYAEGGTYTVTLTVTVSGCENSTTQECTIYLKDELYVPNAFNPNAINPENQVVKVYGSNVAESDFYFKIVNRWGKVMYETKSFAEANTVGWDGVNSNTGEELELNVFSYILKGQFIEGEKFARVGTITKVK